MEAEEPLITRIDEDEREDEVGVEEEKVEGEDNLRNYSKQNENMLIRSKNYLDLNDETRDESRNRLNLSDNLTNLSITPIEIHHCINVNTQTSLDYYFDQEDIDEESRIDLSNFRQQEFDRDDLGSALKGRQEITDGPSSINQELIKPVEATNLDPAQENQDTESKLALLRELLTVERNRNEQRRENNEKMQKYLAQLQADYLRLQRDLLEALELGQKIKAQKEAQLELQAETLREKEKLVEQLRDNLKNLDENKLREEFKLLQTKQNELFNIEKQQLKDQVNLIEQQLAHERVNSSQVFQEFQTKLDDQFRAHNCETSKLRDRLSSLEQELETILGEPKNLVIKKLKEEKNELENQLDELKLVVSENQSKYEKLKVRLESLLGEQEQIERRQQEELDRLEEEKVDQRRQLTELKGELEDKKELVQIVQFNLQRSERRLKSLLVALRGKEAIYKEMVAQLEAKRSEELEKSSNEVRLLERKLADNVDELERKSSEIIRIQLEQENQLESLRNDRDQRVNRLTIERQRAEKELQMVEIRLARHLELEDHKTKLLEQLKLDADKFKEESKRLSIELTRAEGKLFAKQQELNELSNELKANKSRELGRQQAELELDEIKRQMRHLVETIDELRKDNEKLRAKLRFNEMSLSKVSSAIGKEQLKMVNEYERKMEQIRQEQSVYDRNKIRYKRYGYKLKKYCDHLRRVHAHLCNPNVCGYLIGSQPTANSSTKKAPTECSSPTRRCSFNDDSLNLLSPSSNEDENNNYNDNNNNNHYYCTAERPISAAPSPVARRNVTPGSLKSTPANATVQRDKFSIKRTGRAQLTVNKTNLQMSSPISRVQRCVPKRQSTLVKDPSPAEHNYYYINNNDLQQQQVETNCRAII